jgi:hypothetical protein
LNIRPSPDSIRRRPNKEIINFKLGLKPRQDRKYTLTVVSTGEKDMTPEETTDNHYPPTGQLDFVPDGYRIGWSNRGLEIQVTDYHVGALVLPWKLILDLAQASTHGEHNSD